jgi:hypothetical protein
MDRTALDTVRKALAEYDSTNNPAALFTTLHEPLVWQYATEILDDEDAPQYAHTLIRAITAYLPQLRQHDKARDTLVHSLRSNTFGFLYRDTELAVLQHAGSWTTSDALAFFAQFENTYRAQAQAGDHFIGQLALEGAVMLALLRSDDGLLYRAIGLLLSEFPVVPADTGDAAYLPVKAVKLLARCYDRKPGDAAIGDRVRALTGNDNLATQNEARYTLGIIRLYDAFAADNQESFLRALAEARDSFENAARGEEDRSDAELFAAIIECYFLLSSGGPVPEALSSVQRAQAVLAKRLMVFGGTGAVFTSTPQVIAEYRLVQLTVILSQWAEELAHITKQPNIEPPLQVLAHLYEGVRLLDIPGGLLSGSFSATQELVMLPSLRGRFAHVQEIKAKLDALIDGARLAELPRELEFYELARKLVEEIPDPKAWADTDLEGLAVAAGLVAPQVASELAAIRSKGLEPKEALVQVLSHWLDSERKYGPELYGPAADIYSSLSTQLLTELEWDANSPKWRYLSYALKLIANYHVALYSANRPDWAPIDINFLFDKRNGGKGQNAVEADIESNFNMAMKLANGHTVERQPQSVTQGTPDLYLRFPYEIEFPLEIKREKVDTTRESIDKKYVAQPQQYGASALGVSFLFVLDLTPKELGTPLASVTDYAYIAYRTVPNTVRPARVVVFIFPANRPLPSDHSWNAKPSRDRAEWRGQVDRQKNSKPSDGFTGPTTPTN